MKSKSLIALREKCVNTAKVLKSLSHPHRLQLLCWLVEGERTVGELEDFCGASQSAVSQFLGRMKTEGLVASNKEGPFVTYRIADARIRKTIQALQKIYSHD